MFPGSTLVKTTVIENSTETLTLTLIVIVIEIYKITNRESLLLELLS